MNDALDSLCSLLDEEIERQENVLAVVRGQGDAARGGDIETLEARTEALTLLIAEGIDAEGRRVAVLREIVAGYALPVDEQTLSHLIARTPDPWKRRLTGFQSRLRALVAETQEALRANERMVRRGLRIVNGAIEVLGEQLGSGRPAYGAQGTGQAPGAPRPALIDQRG